MSRKPPPGLFVTGTNTGVGKTFVSCRIAEYFVRRGMRVGVYKPVTSGCDSHLDLATVAQADSASAEDAVLLWRAAGCPGDVERVSPQRFSAPLAPHLAARAEGKTLDSAALRTGIEYWRERSDLVIVEGAGGLLTPLGDQEYVADLVADLGYPLLIVAANQLGCLGQTGLTLHAARTWRDGLNPIAVVLNHVSERDEAADASLASNFEQLKIHCGGLAVAQLGHRGMSLDPELPWETLIEWT